jgi:hypothetical protein
VTDNAPEVPQNAADINRRFSRPLGIFVAWRLHALGYILAGLFAVLFFLHYKAGYWPINNKGVPVYTDFVPLWLAGVIGLHGGTSLLYHSAEFVKLQQIVVGPQEAFYPSWPYPPTALFMAIPFAMLPYLYAFIVWDVVTLFACTTVVYLIVRRGPAIALVLASPFTALTLLAGQNGLLLASGIGGSLLLLERRPVLAGALIGCLTLKPQFGILIPVALIAGKRWRALASAGMTTVFLVGASIAAFGSAIWGEFPKIILARAGEVLVAGGQVHETPDWGYIHTVYGLARYLDGGAALAWFAQTVATVSVAVVVWLVWRSSVRYPLKAAALSAAALIATPYAYSPDLAAIAIPVAFLAKDQLNCGLLKGEQSIIIALFGAGVVVLFASGSIPIGPVMMITLFLLVVRRALDQIAPAWPDLKIEPDALPTPR